MAIAGWRSSGSRPTPSGGAGESLTNGFASINMRPQKKVARPPRTAVAQGASSRWRFRVANSTAEEAIESTQAHRSSEPSWLDHIAVSLYPRGVVVEE